MLATTGVAAGAATDWIDLFKTICTLLTAVMGVVTILITHDTNKTSKDTQKKVNGFTHEMVNNVRNESAVKEKAAGLAGQLLGRKEANAANAAAETRRNDAAAHRGSKG